MEIPGSTSVNRLSLNTLPGSDEILAGGNVFLDPADETFSLESILAASATTGPAPEAIQAFISYAYRGDEFILYQVENAAGDTEVRIRSISEHAENTGIAPDLLVGTYNRSVTRDDFALGSPLYANLQSSVAELEALNSSLTGNSASIGTLDDFVDSAATSIVTLPTSVASIIEEGVLSVPAFGGDVLALGEQASNAVLGTEFNNRSNPLNMEARRIFTETGFFNQVDTVLQESMPNLLDFDDTTWASFAGSVAGPLVITSPLVRGTATPTSPTTPGGGSSVTGATLRK